MTSIISTLDPSRVVTLMARPTVYLGEGAVHKLSEALSQITLTPSKDHVLVVASRGAYQVSGAWAAIEPQLKQLGLSFTVFNGISANPTVDEIDRAADVGRQVGASLILAIGGGSPIDAAKGVAALLANPGFTARGLYSLTDQPDTALPLIAVSLTHGTGSEVNRYSVATVPETQHKPGIGYPCLYPRFAIVDPLLMQTLPEAQTRITAVDALNHALEAATSLIANPLSMPLSQEAIRLIVESLPLVLRDKTHRRGRWALATAATLAGIAIDNGAVHVTHALEHPLSAVQPDLPHALGLGMLLPAVLKACYPSASKVYTRLLTPILIQQGISDERVQKSSLSAVEIARAVERWLFEMGMTEKLHDRGFSVDQIPHLLDLVYETPTLQPLVSLAPGKLQREDLTRIYQESLTPFNALASVS